MQVSVLVIIYRGREYITLHDDEESVQRALRAFVDERWTDRPREACAAVPATSEERIKVFFEASGDLYLCGKADLSELDAHVASAIAD